MLFTDLLTLDAPRRTTDGYLAVRARAARTGVYQYTGREVDPDNKHGLRDTAIVNVLRDDHTVFDKASAQSFIGKPITDDHPRQSVTASNWRDHARGTIMGALRDGEHLAFDLLLTDAGAIAKVDAGKRELSNGYAAELEFGDFTAPDNTKCQARQTRITGNHVALVDRGRAGSECAIASCDALPAAFLDGITLPSGDLPMKTLTIDGLRVPNVSDEAEAAITKLLANNDTLQGKLTVADAKVAELTTEGATKDAKITTLEKAVVDAKLTPAQLRDAAQAYAGICDKATALGVKFADEADSGTIMKAVVAAKMGDAAKEWTDEQIAASFAVLTKDVKAGGSTKPAVVPIGDARPFAGADIRSLARSVR